MRFKVLRCFSGDKIRFFLFAIPWRGDLKLEILITRFFGNLGLHSSRFERIFVETLPLNFLAMNFLRQKYVQNQHSAVSACRNQKLFSS